MHKKIFGAYSGLWTWSQDPTQALTRISNVSTGKE